MMSLIFGAGLNSLLQFAAKATENNFQQQPTSSGQKKVDTGWFELSPETQKKNLATLDHSSRVKRLQVKW